MLQGHSREVMRAFPSAPPPRNTHNNPNDGASWWSNISEYVYGLSSAPADDHKMRFRRSRTNGGASDGGAPQATVYSNPRYNTPVGLSSSLTVASGRHSDSVGYRASTAIPALPRVAQSASGLSPQERMEDRTPQQHFSAVLNDPRYASAHEAAHAPLLIGPLPGLSDGEIGLETIFEYSRRMKESSETWYRQIVQASRAREAQSGKVVQDNLERSLRHCRATIPAEFFDARYDQSRQGFYHASEDGDAEGVVQTRSKLTQLLELVEHNLFNQISTKSASFFFTLKLVAMLRREIDQSLTITKVIRQRVGMLSDGLVKSGLGVVKKKRRADNVRTLLHTMELLQTVTTTQSTVKLLLANKDFSSALDIIRNTRELVATKLQGLKCMANIDLRLSQMAVLIDKLMLEGMFETLVGERNDEYPSSSSSSSSPPPLAPIPPVTVLTAEEAQDVKQFARNFHLLGKMHLIGKLCYQHLSQVIKKALTDLVFAHLGDMDMGKEAKKTAPQQDKEENQVDMIARFEALGHSDFLALMDRLLGYLLCVFARVKAVVFVILNEVRATLTTRSDYIFDHAVIESMRREGTLGGYVDTVVRSMNDLVYSVCEFGHAKCARILSTRQSVHAHLDVVAFHEIVTKIDTFVQKTSALVENKEISKFPAMVQKQCKLILQRFHQSRVGALSLALDTDSWKRVLVPRFFQLLLSRKFVFDRGDGKESSPAHALLEGALREVAMYDPKKRSDKQDVKSNALKLYADVAPEAAQLSFSSAAYASSSQASSSSPATTERLVFPATRHLLTMLFVCAEYVEFVRLLPLTHTTVISKVVELLTLYNSRVCQLILGASAMETVQLKSITATHLALASQAIQLMQTQIPVLKEELARYVSNQNHIVLLDAMDRVHGDYVNHQKEILQKLVAIMDHLVGRTAGKISRAAWIRVDYKESSLGGQASSGEMDQSLQVLWKQINSLHNTLSDLLLPSQRTFVFAQVGTSIQAHFLKAINDVYKSSVVLKTSPRSEHAINIRHRLCVILQHMLMKVRTIPSFQDDACVRLQREHDRIQQES